MNKTVNALEFVITNPRIFNTENSFILFLHSQGYFEYKFLMKNLWDITKLLFPLNRSLTGEGNRDTFKIIKKSILPNLEIKKIKSGTGVFDWNIPPEWNVSDAYILDKKGNKIVDFKKNNLHLMGYSVPVNKIISKNELLKKLNF